MADENEKKTLSGWAKAFFGSTFAGLVLLAITSYTLGTSEVVDAKMVNITDKYTSIKARVDAYEISQRKDQGKFEILSSADAATEATMKAFAGSMTKVENGIDKLIDLMTKHIEDHP